MAPYPKYTHRKQTTLRLRPEVHHELKVFAVSQQPEWTITEVLESLVLELLAGRIHLPQKVPRTETLLTSMPRAN